MILLRLADVPRSTRRLPRPLPALADAEGRSAGAVVRWGLRPALLDAGDRAALTRVAAVVAAYEARAGCSRAQLRAGERALEEVVGDYRLARCLARCVEESYSFVAPRTAAPLAPQALRAHVYARAHAGHGGFVPAAARAEFLAAVAVELGCSPWDVEDALLADTPSRAVLTRGAGGPPSPREVARRYNAAVVATLLAAASFVVVRLPLEDVAALKELYRRARGLRVGVDLVLGGTARDGGGGACVEATLYGPGSRALVRLREAVVDEGETEAEGEEQGTDDAEHAALLPAAGGPALPLVVAGLAARRRGLSGWAHLLGPDRRLYHYPLDAAGLAALVGDERALDAGGEEGEEGSVAAPAYDSAVEADFGAAFLAQQGGGRMGVTRGWTILREPRPIIAGATVFLPDFALRRGDIEVLCEIVGYYTEDYLARKRRKLAALRGRITLLLVVDEALAAHVGGTGFPIITYRGGQSVRVTEVVAALEREFDPFSRRRAAGGAALRALCAEAGPPLEEERLCHATGSAGRGELEALWEDVAAGADAERLARRYVAGQGLVPSTAVASAQEVLVERLGAAGGCLPLDEALALCRTAGLPAPDDALLAVLGVEVRRRGLFGDALACLPGSVEGLPDDPPSVPRKRRR